MKKVLIFLFFVCLLLSSWQIYRFYSKKHQAEFLILKNELLINSNNDSPILNEKINEENLYKKIALCGKYHKNEAFVLYKPKNDRLDHSSEKLHYEIIFPIHRQNQIILINYAPENIFSLTELRNLIDKTENQSMCFTGILLDINKMNSNRLNKFFIKNKNNDNIWLRLDKSDLQIKFPNDQINYFLDTNLKNLTYLIKSYNHHLYYAIMWLGLALYSLFLFIKNKQMFIK